MKSPLNIAVRALVQDTAISKLIKLLSAIVLVFVGIVGFEHVPAYEKGQK